MKYPVVFRVLAAITLLLGLVAGIIAIGLSSDVRGGKQLNYESAMAAAFFAGFFFWAMLASSFWFFGSRSGYMILVGNAFALGLFIELLLERFIVLTESGDRTGLLIAVLPVAVLLLFHIAALFYPALKPVRAQALEVKRMVAISGAFVTLLLAPRVSVWAVQRFGQETIPVQVYNVETQGDLGEYLAANMIDGDLKTWWTPANHTGKNATFTMYFTRAEVIALKVHPGSHFPDYPKLGDLFKKNSRLQNAELTFSDGSHQVIDLSDEDRLQRIDVKPITTRSMTVRITSTIPGTNWNDLCISEFTPLTHRSRFKE